MPQVSHTWALDRALHTVLIVIHAGLAATILMGGEARFSSPTYTQALRLAHGQAWPWAAALGIAAILMCSGSRLLDIVGLALGTIWMYTFGSLFAAGIVTSSTTAGPPVIMYFGVGLLNAITLTDRVVKFRSRDHGKVG